MTNKGKGWRQPVGLLLRCHELRIEGLNPGWHDLFDTCDTHDNPYRGCPPETR